MKNSNFPIRRLSQVTPLRNLLVEARRDRRQRLRDELATREGGAAREILLRRRRAAVLIERMLCRRSSLAVDLGRFLNVWAGRQQMASAVITRMMVSIEKVVISPVKARALAVALTELVHFAEASAPSDGSLGVYLAVALDDDLLIVGLGFDGDVRPLAPAGATWAMLRASKIVRLLHGDFQRGVDGVRMVFGLTFPRELIFEPVS